jgi:hypothetical protein
MSGGCHCGNIVVDFELTRALDTYNPRACDCDFCRKHGAAYLSDAMGSLLIRIKDARASAKYRQGSKQAEFLLCSNCGVLVGILHQGDDRLYGTLNVKALDDAAHFGAEQQVSPKKLSGTDKVKRWQDIWFSKVEVVNTDA